MSGLSNEALVIAGAWWGVLMTSEVKFERPWIIHPKTRKGLDELVEKGYLTVEKFNNPASDALIWKPTEKMKTERPVREAFGKDWKKFELFMEANTFPITDESQTKEAYIEVDIPK